MIRFAIVHTDYKRNPSVLLLHRSRKGAIELWEERNPGIKFSDVKKHSGWMVQKYSLELYTK